MNKLFDEKIQNQMKQLLDSESELLDLKTQLALEKSRTDAINSPSTNPFVLSDTLVLSQIFNLKTTIMALVLIVASLWYFQHQGLQEKVSINTPFNDIELLSSEPSIDFYEDINFYQWLDSNET